MDEASEEDEGDLVERARAGDREAFADLVRLHQDRVYRLALRMVGVDAAEDVAQQTFLHAWQAISRFEQRSAFGTWLYRAAINACTDVLRRQGRFRPLPLEDVEHALPSAEPDVAEEVHQRMEDQERRQALAWALDRLPTDDRVLLYLRLGEVLSYEALADVLGLNVRTVGTRLFRARSRLRTLVSQCQALERG